jgi:hypothetical protein
MKPNVRAGAVVALVLVVSATAATALATQPASIAPDGSAVDRPSDRLDGPRTGVSRQESATPDIQVRPETLQFPNGTDGGATRTLTVRNVGDAPLTVRSIAIVGPDRRSFGRVFDGPVTIDPDGGRDVAVSFEGADSRPRFATLHVMSDDPDEPQTNVWLTNTRTVADVSPSRVLETKTLVNATVRNATANTTQSLNLSWPLTRDDVIAVDALSFTPLRDGDVTLSVATNASRFGTVPAFDREDGTEAAGFVHVEHSVANEDVEDVTFTVRVRKDRLAGDETGPEDVALYRHEAGAWTELPTRLVSEGGAHYFYEASAPGLSDFTTGVKQAKFRITDAVVTVTRIRTDEGTTVLVRVRNVGGADGTYEVKLRLEDAVVDRRELSIAPDGTRQASFERTFDEPGAYEVYVNERFVGSVTVERPETTESGVTTAAPADDSSPTDRSLPGFGAGAAAVVVLVVTLRLAVDRRR